MPLAGPAMRGPGRAAGCSGPGGGRVDPGGARGAIRGGERTIGDLKRGHTRRPYARSVQLYVNLRGFDPSGRPVAAAEAIRAVLDTVGVPAGQIPAGLDALAGLYRSVLAGKRMLVLLGNARDAGQIRPPRPPSGRLPVARGHTPQPAGCAPRSTAASSGRWRNASWRP